VDDRLREDGGRRGAVAGLLLRLLGRLAHEARTEILEWICELDVLGDRHTVVDDERKSGFATECDIVAARPQRKSARAAVRQAAAVPG
jgi:hypothetical protein